MKDEEMAEEYAKEKLSEEDYKLSEEVIKPIYHNAIKNDYSFAKYGVECYLAGLKAGRTQWHDLRENPNNLPIGEVFYWFDENPNLKDRKVYGRSIGYYNPCEKEWHGYYKGCPCRIHNVIAWCEIPTFDNGCNWEK